MYSAGMYGLPRVAYCAWTLTRMVQENIPPACTFAKAALVWLIWSWTTLQPYLNMSSLTQLNSPLRPPNRVGIRQTEDSLDTKEALFT